MALCCYSRLTCRAEHTQSSGIQRAIEPNAEDIAATDGNLKGYQLRAHSGANRNHRTNGREQ